MKLSAVIIAKNEEKMIEECIKSLSFCDEIIVIDNNSKDRTVEIAKKYNAKVYTDDYSDFSESRNLGLDKAEGDWILYVDADERVSKELAESIKEKINNEEFKVFKVVRKNYYFGNNEWPHLEKLERLFLKKEFKGWTGKLHESPVYDGKAGVLNGFLLHYTHRDLSSMVTKTNKWSDTEALLRFNSNHPKMTWWRFPRVMLTAFFDSYVRQGGWKAGVVGLIESIYQSFSIFITYVKLWELQNLHKK
jgi:glycosyltransferase involved in cell wall biosynthesis